MTVGHDEQRVSGLEARFLGCFPRCGLSGLLRLRSSGWLRLLSRPAGGSDFGAVLGVVDPAEGALEIGLGESDAIQTADQEPGEILPGVSEGSRQSSRDGSGDSLELEKMCKSWLLSYSFHAALPALPVTETIPDCRHIAGRPGAARTNPYTPALVETAVDGRFD